MNKPLIALVAVIILGGAFFIMMQGKGQPVVEVPNTTDTPSAAMRAEDNMVVVTEQKPGNTVTVSQVHLAAPGFVVIHEDTNDVPGAILGSSAALSAGDSAQIKITLSRTVKDSEKLHAMLHNDIDGNGKFDASIDMPVQSALGGPIEGWFTISSQAAENVPVSI